MIQFPSNGWFMLMCVHTKEFGNRVRGYLNVAYLLHITLRGRVIARHHSNPPPPDDRFLILLHQVCI